MPIRNGLKEAADRSISLEPDCRKPCACACACEREENGKKMGGDEVYSHVQKRQEHLFTFGYQKENCRNLLIFVCV